MTGYVMGISLERLKAVSEQKQKQQLDSDRLESKLDIPNCDLSLIFDTEYTTSEALAEIAEIASNPTFYQYPLRLIRTILDSIKE